MWFFGVLAGAGLWMVDRGQGLGPVPDSWFYVGGWILFSCASVAWVVEATRPWWRRRLPRGFTLVNSEPLFRGERAGVRFQTRFVVDLGGRHLPSGLKLECDQPILDVEWRSIKRSGSSRTEDLKRQHESPTKVTLVRTPQSDETDAARIELEVLSNKPTALERLRVVKPPTAPPRSK